MKDNPLLDPLGATWAETIAALPTQEERDEATHFIEHDLRKGAGNGILRGMFLLLKANRCYLEKLPGQFNHELVQPLVENMLRIETSIAQQVEIQKEIVGQMDRCFVSASRSADRMEAVVPRMERVVQNSFDKIDTKALTRQITDTVVKSTVEPVAETNRELQKMLKLLTGLIEKAKEVLDILPKIAWRQILLGSLGVTFGFWAIIFIFAYQGMKQSFNASLDLQDQKLHALAGAIEKAQNAAIGNQLACDELSHLQATIEVKLLSDDPGHYILILPGADAAQVIDGKGAISFHGNDIGSLIEQRIEETRKLLGH
ncbi:MAG: hypothetical protein LV480_00505 [Methylacidiphilales bacterium]|nr:hypothetical protein [Candidatus Methylacidiphilales bacterium]